MTLDGLEAAVKAAAPRRAKVNVIRYADDFVITGKTQELLETTIKPAVEKFLLERGLTLSPEKTRITRIEDGFDFLGQNPRKYQGKLLIKPARDNVAAFLTKIRKSIRKFTARKTGDLIRTLNPIIRGWANFHRHIVASSTFKSVDNQIYCYLWDWAKKRHQDKGKMWLVRKYWRGGPTARSFGTVEQTPDGKRRVELLRASQIHIKRHVKVRSDANPFDPHYDDYFAGRKADRQRRHIGGSAAQAA